MQSRARHIAIAKVSGEERCRGRPQHHAGLLPLFPPRSPDDPENDWRRPRAHPNSRVNKLADFGVLYGQRCGAHISVIYTSELPYGATLVLNAATSSRCTLYQRFTVWQFLFRGIFFAGVACSDNFILFHFETRQGDLGAVCWNIAILSGTRACTYFWSKIFIREISKVDFI